MISQIRLQLRYMAIEEMSTTDTFSVVLLCEIAQVSRAAYYKWLKRTVSVREEENLSLLEDIRLLYDQVNGTYGYRRITMTVNRRRHQYVAENLMNREFSASRPDEKWCTDVTEFKYGAGKKAYLSAIIDLYDGSIVAYRVGKSNNNGLVFHTMLPAIAELRTGASPMIHSDRGFQYTSRGFKRMVADARLTHSMSRVGRCLDNAPIESFWVL